MIAPTRVASPALQARGETLLMRQILHPGTPEPERSKIISVQAESLDATLAPGSTLLESLARLLAAHGATSGALRLGGGAFRPFSYVMPAASPDKEHVAWFSHRFEVPEGVRFVEGSVTFGLRNGDPWLHCHAIWVEPGGARRCGHLLPDHVVISEPIRVSGCTIRGGDFTVVADPESNFSLFEPRPEQGVEAKRAGIRALAVRLRPNVDVCTALETICVEHGFNAAVVQGGVGSIVGTVFEDGRRVLPIATEMMIRSGRIEPDAAGNLRATLDVALVDDTEAVNEGRLQRGDNPVLITFELVLLAG